MAPISIVDGGELQVRSLLVSIYGAPNLGKTTLGLTADTPLLLDFDGGAYRAGNRAGKSVVAVESWDDVASLTGDDLKPFKTVIVDTVGTCLEKIIADIIRRNPKLGRGGQPTMNGWGELKTRFASWLALLKSSGLDVVMIAHGAEEQRGEETVDRIVAPGSSRQLVYQQADMMGRLAFDGNDRVLTFNPTATSYAKNVGLPDRVFREASYNPAFLADLIVEAKTLLNSASTATVDQHSHMDELREKFSAMPVSAVAYNAQADEMSANGLVKSEALLLIEVGESKGLVFDRQARRFTDPPTPAPAAAPDAAPSMPF